MTLHTALFFDRDGVIVENREEYIRTWDDVVFIQGVFSAMQRLANSTYRIFIITNQSAVGRGFMTLELANEINHRIVHDIELHGGRVDSVYMCPHAPIDNCQCRKPAPGMILQAAAEHSLDLSASFLIGDSTTDLLAGQAAGIGQLVLVRTGRGAAQEAELDSSGLADYAVFDNLPQAVTQLPLNLS